MPFGLSVPVMPPVVIASSVGEVIARLNILPSETTTLSVAVSGSVMPLSTLLSARSTVTRICTGPWVVPARNDAEATPCTVRVLTLEPVLEPPAPRALIVPKLEPPTTSNCTLLKAVLPLPGLGTNWPPPSRTTALMMVLLEPPLSWM
ncbi:hypothetical protein ACFJIW_08530 [Tahibacter sp. UC22_41]|uniref:hypothetical protein n=1 Tax=Tahibacter sp. UC22_41 TaxID=3350178 RepID=UPI0036DE7514